MHEDVRSILETARGRAESSEARVDNVEARDFVGAVEGKKEEGKVPIIAEVKPTSPTTEGTSDYDPVEAAREMVAGGAV
ncbi:MAG: indole-3-glycerol-phosphate synthase, partial [Halobacteria archaeon]|nr:indole-3-glycerol-phosphate synthase [Halobacteria archaeon]